MKKQNLYVKTFIRAGFLSRSSLILLMLSFFVTSYGSAEVIETIDAMVNDEPVFSSEVDQVLQSTYSAEEQRSLTPEQKEVIQRRILSRIIDDVLVVQAIRNRLNQKDEERIRKYIEEQTDKYLDELRKTLGTPENIAQYEQRMGVSWQDLRAIKYEELYKENLRVSVIPQMTRGLASPPTAEEIEQFQRDNPDQRPDGEIVAAHVLLRVFENATAEQEAEVRMMAEKIAARAREGEPFDSLAARFSQHEQSKSSGGRLPPFKKGTMYPEFDSLFDMNPGEVTDPIRTPLGYHVIKVIKMNTLADLVFQRKWDKATSEWLNKLRENATIRIRQGTEFVELSE